MKKMIYASIILFLFIGVSAPAAFAADCPDCPKKMKNTLDPNWKYFKPPALTPGERASCHRVQFGKQTCIDCHKKDTPKTFLEWQGSKHGIMGVKCGTCHGDAVNYRSMPDRQVCIGCHSAQVNHMPKNALVTNCAFCHKGHWFTVHNIDTLKRFPVDRKLRFKVPGF